jgi:hypothetical protein
MRNSPSTTSIHIIDDDSLLNVFYLYRPFLLGDDDDDEGSRLFGGVQLWDRGRWWYKLAHVCQRWRNVVLESAAYLGVSLVCTNGTPVADMLAHSPPLPLVIDYIDEKFHDDLTLDLTPLAFGDEEGAILALKQFDRVRRVRLRTSAMNLQKLIVVMDNEYSILEYLIIGLPIEDDTTFLMFPETLQAPRLRHLALVGFALPIGSRLLTTAMDLVTLCLFMISPSTYFHPNTLLQWVSFMPHLETLLIGFEYPAPSHDVERQLTHMPITTLNILPNLYSFTFNGVGTYLEALVHQITTPRLEKLQLEFFNQLPFSITRLLQFLSSTNLKFKTATVEFYNEAVYVSVYPHEEAETYALSIIVNCCHLDGQVSSMAQILDLLSSMFSAVERLTLEHKGHILSSDEYNEADRGEWHRLLNAFRNVKSLHVTEGLVEKLSFYLQLDGRELTIEILPELQELTYSGSGNTGGAFTSFIDARQNAGHPITLIRS